MICRRDHSAATVVAQAIPDYSAVREGPQKATVLVAVGIGPDGKVTSVHLAKSSGNDLIDEAALKASYASTFRAATLRCKPTAGNVTLTFQYQ